MESQLKILNLGIMLNEIKRHNLFKLNFGILQVFSFEYSCSGFLKFDLTPMSL